MFDKEKKYYLHMSAYVDKCVCVLVFVNVCMCMHVYVYVCMHAHV